MKLFLIMIYCPRTQIDIYVLYIAVPHFRLIRIIPKELFTLCNLWMDKLKSIYFLNNVPLASPSNMS